MPMPKKVAIFVDWENLRLEIEHCQSELKHSLGRQVLNYNDVKQVLYLINSFLEDGEELLRVYFYTAPYYSADELSDAVLGGAKSWDVRKELFTQYFANHRDHVDKLHSYSTRFIQNMSIEDYVAVRVGTLKVLDIQPDGRPIITQKQVDMMLGMDVYHTAVEKQADRVIIFSKDTDIKPALVVARQHGLQTIMPALSEGYRIPMLLKKHNDIVRERSLVSVDTAYQTENSSGRRSNENN